MFRPLPSCRERDVKLLSYHLDGVAAVQILCHWDSGSGFCPPRLAQRTSKTWRLLVVGYEEADIQPYCIAVVEVRGWRGVPGAIARLACAPAEPGVATGSAAGWRPPTAVDVRGGPARPRAEAAPPPQPIDS